MRRLFSLSLSLSLSLSRAFVEVALDLRVNGGFVTALRPGERLIRQLDKSLRQRSGGHADGARVVAAIGGMGTRYFIGVTFCYSAR
jgi:hypothetical protein